MANTYNEGQRIKITVQFRDADTNALVDPTIVRFCTLDPENVSKCYRYLADPEITKTAVGCYRFDLLLDKHGWWHYGWFSSGNYDGTSLSEVHACELPVSTWPAS